MIETKGEIFVHLKSRVYMYIAIVDHTYRDQVTDEGMKLSIPS